MTCKNCIHSDVCQLRIRNGILTREDVECTCPNFMRNFPRVGSPCWFENTRYHCIEEGTVVEVQLRDNYYVVLCEFSGEILHTASNTPNNYIFFDKEDNAKFFNKEELEKLNETHIPL